MSRSSIYRLKKQDAIDFRKGKKQKRKGGRPRKITTREERIILRKLHALRRREGNFTSRRIMKESGLVNISDRTLRRALNRRGYFSLQARKKGLITTMDRKKRYQFAKKTLKEEKEDVWTSKVSFFLDGVGFYYKRNPYDQARAPRGRIWRKKSEGLKLGCTAKGSKEGSGGKVLKLMAAITHGKGVIFCHRYSTMNGAEFEKFVKEHFDDIFRKSGKKGPRIFVQDNDPSQNCALAKKLFKKKKIKQLTIPARSPDINPIENLFNSIKVLIREEAIHKNITRETFDEFSDRVIQTLYRFPVDVINKTIESMNKRILQIKACKGERLKY